MHFWRDRKTFLCLAGLAASLLWVPAAHADLLHQIKARGELVCATLSDNEPLGFVDPQSRKIVGFDVDLCTSLAREMGVRMAQKSVSVADRIPVLIQGQADVVVAALGYTRERARQVDFSAAYYQNAIRVIVRSDSAVNSLGDLANHRISANRNSTPEFFLRRMLPKASVVALPDTPSNFLALAKGEVDGMALSQPSGIRFVNESDGRYRFVEGALAWEPTAVGVRKGEPALLEAVNAALARLEAAGELDAIWTRWYGPKTKFSMRREKKLTPITAFY